MQLVFDARGDVTLVRVQGPKLTYPVLASFFSEVRQRVEGGARKIVIDLGRLDDIGGPTGEMLRRYLAMIQVQRQDFNGRVLTIRRDDLQALAAILGTDIGGAQGKLAGLGLRHDGAGATAPTAPTAPTTA